MDYIKNEKNQFSYSKVFKNRYLTILYIMQIFDSIAQAFFLPQIVIHYMFDFKMNRILIMLFFTCGSIFYFFSCFAVSKLLKPRKEYLFVFFGFLFESICYIFVGPSSFTNL